MADRVEFSTEQSHKVELVEAQENAKPRRMFSGRMTHFWDSLEVGKTQLMDSISLGGIGLFVEVMEIPGRKWPAIVTLETVPRT